MNQHVLIVEDETKIASLLQDYLIQSGYEASIIHDGSAVKPWLDENHLAYGALDETGNLGTAVVTLDGQVTQLSPNFALGVLR